MARQRVPNPRRKGTPAKWHPATRATPPSSIAAAMPLGLADPERQYAIITRKCPAHPPGRPSCVCAHCLAERALSEAEMPWPNAMTRRVGHGASEGTLRPPPSATGARAATSPSGARAPSSPGTRSTAPGPLPPAPAHPVAPGRRGTTALTPPPPSATGARAATSPSGAPAPSGPGTRSTAPGPRPPAPAHPVVPGRRGTTAEHAPTMSAPAYVPPGKRPAASGAPAPTDTSATPAAWMRAAIASLPQPSYPGTLVSMSIATASSSPTVRSHETARRSRPFRTH